MITAAVQRWRTRCDSYRPAGEVFVPHSFDVAPITSDRIARAFIECHHYSSTYPAARFRFGLFERDRLTGVAVFSVPMTAAVFDPLPRDASVELGRFVLLDEVKANGESWFLARCFELLRREAIAGIVSFSDPEPRTDATGRIIFRGHIGTIYQATNAVYVGRGRARVHWLFPDGTVLNPRTLQKIRAKERGWRYAVNQIIEHGANPPDRDDLRHWLAAELPRVTRPLRHGGNHKYLFALNRAARRVLPVGNPYPKFRMAA